MQISPIQQHNNSFKALKNMKFLKAPNPMYDFNPKYNIKDAEIVDAFMKNDAFNKLFKDYDAWATFYSYEWLGKPFNGMHLHLKEVDTVIPQEKSFIKKITEFLGFKKHQKEPSEEDYTAFVTLSNRRDNRSLKQIISETTEKDLRVEILLSKNIVAEKKENAKKRAERLKDINESIKNYVQ